MITQCKCQFGRFNNRRLHYRSPSSYDITSADLMYLRKSNSTNLLRISRLIFLLENSDLCVGYLLSFCELNKNLLLKVELWTVSNFNLSSKFQPLETGTFFGFGPEPPCTPWKHIWTKKVNMLNSPNGGILLRKSSHWEKIFPTKRQCPALFCCQ